MSLWIWLNIFLTTKKSHFSRCCSKSLFKEEVLLVGEDREEDEGEEVLELYRSILYHHNRLVLTIISFMSISQTFKTF